MPENWLLFVAEHGTGDKKQKIATSMIAVSANNDRASSQNDSKNRSTEDVESCHPGLDEPAPDHDPGGSVTPLATQTSTAQDPRWIADQVRNNRVLTAYGRYWGALARVDCLHFEACYYQPLQWCIDHGFSSFEGGAQGEHKMARALLPVKTTSAHWLAHPSFADAIERFLQREGSGINNYMDELERRSPFKQI